MTATSVQYIGLTLTYASSFQMLRGAVIIFTGILSTIFLRRRLAWFKWTGMIFVIGGLVTVGVSDMMTQKPCKPDNTTTSHSSNVTSEYEFEFSYAPLSVLGAKAADCKNDTTSIFVGDLLIFCSQIIVASQMVYEEKFISKYNVPALQAVGWEGTFGFATLSLLLVPFSFIYVGTSFGHGPRYVLEDAYDGVYQLSHNPLLALAFSGRFCKLGSYLKYCNSRYCDINCLLQLCWHLRDQGADSHHQDGAGQCEDPGHMGGQHGHWLAELLLPPAHRVLYPVGGDDALQ